MVTTEKSLLLSSNILLLSKYLNPGPLLGSMLYSMILQRLNNLPQMKNIFFFLKKLQKLTFLKTQQLTQNRVI